MDTARLPRLSCKTIHHRYYDGNDIIVLPDDNLQVLNVQHSPYLKEHIGHGVITASGLTLQEQMIKTVWLPIMEAAMYLVQNPAGKTRRYKNFVYARWRSGTGRNWICKTRCCLWLYTLDGGEAGGLEDETFSAIKPTITIHGVITSSRLCKNKLVNAYVKIAGGCWMPCQRIDEWKPPIRCGLCASRGCKRDLRKKPPYGQFVCVILMMLAATTPYPFKRNCSGVVATFPGAAMEWKTAGTVPQYEERAEELPGTGYAAG